MPRPADTASDLVAAGERGTSDNGSRSQKLGEVVARRIEKKIMEAGWPLGQVIGSEADLLQEHHVSRAVLREAIRLLEHHGTATMRRGPGGGLVVTKPDIRAVTQSAAVYLDSEQITPRKLSAARSAIELIAVQLAAESIDEEGVVRLRTVLEREESAVGSGRPPGSRPDDIHSVIAQLSGNPAIQLFTETLAKLELELALSASTSGSAPHFRKTFLEDHKQIVTAIISGDPGVARIRMQQHLARVSDELHPH